MSLFIYVFIYLFSCGLRLVSYDFSIQVSLYLVVILCFVSPS